MDSGREREAAEIVRYKLAAAVGRLLLGEFDGPLKCETRANKRLQPTRFASDGEPSR